MLTLGSAMVRVLELNLGLDSLDFSSSYSETEVRAMHYSMGQIFLTFVSNNLAEPLNDHER